VLPAPRQDIGQSLAASAYFNVSAIKGSIPL